MQTYKNVAPLVPYFPFIIYTRKREVFERFVDHLLCPLPTTNMVQNKLRKKKKASMSPLQLIKKGKKLKGNTVMESKKSSIPRKGTRLDKE